MHDGNNYIFKGDSSKARSLLVSMWMLLGFLLTLSYKSALRAQLMKIDYEETIDNIDDMIESKMKLVTACDTLIPVLFRDDPRPEVRIKLRKMIECYDFGTGRPEWVDNG